MLLRESDPARVFYPERWKDRHLRYFNQFITVGYRIVSGRPDTLNNRFQCFIRILILAGLPILGVRASQIRFGILLSQYVSHSPCQFFSPKILAGHLLVNTIQSNAVATSRVKQIFSINLIIRTYIQPIGTGTKRQ